MKIKAVCCFVISVLIVPYSLGQNKEYQATRVNEDIKVDAVLDEEIWSTVPKISNFIQTSPDPEAESTQKSEVQLVYDDEAIYIAATLYDNDPKTFYKELGQRDNLNVSADGFFVFFDTFNDDQNGFGFGVTAAGVQADAKYSPNGEDFSFDAVWQSKVRVTDEAWYVELKIPYFSLRFPDKAKQEWGFNILRVVRRNREQSFWNFIDPNENGFVNQWGVLKGIENVKPPMRLSFTPFVSTNMAKQGASKLETQFNAGMDLKYGITESFTLDMTLIPDFGGVQSDEQILNLGPFEQVYNENRSFFNEGTELFDKAGLFYSRRIGQTPTGYYSVSNELNEHEIVTENPYRTRLINGSKISGRTNTNWGLGFFNAITNKATASILDTISQTEREIETEALTNYNIIVAEKAMKNASSMYLINTNVTRAGDARDANVTGFGATLRDKENKYKLTPSFALSQVFSDENGMRSNKTGYKAGLRVQETQAPLTFTLGSYIEDDKYDPNDLGLLFSNNEFSSFAFVGYQKNKETNWYRSIYAEAGINYERLYNPSKSVGTYLNAFGNIVFPNVNNMWLAVFSSPKGNNDYFEPRVSDFQTYFHKPARTFGEIGYSTDYNKRIAFDIAVERGYGNDYLPVDAWNIFAGPIIRFSDKFNTRIRQRYSNNKGNVGYATTIDNQPVFGIRDRISNSTSLNLEYRFNENMNISGISRYSWDTVDYSEFYTLNEKGEYGSEMHFSDPDQVPNDLNFSAFNADLIFRWRFAPGSDIVAVYKTQIGDLQNNLQDNYFDNFSSMWQQDHGDSFNLKLIYFIDYNQLRKKG